MLSCVQIAAPFICQFVFILFICHKQPTDVTVQSFTCEIGLYLLLILEDFQFSLRIDETMLSFEAIFIFSQEFTFDWLEKKYLLCIQFECTFSSNVGIYCVEDAANSRNFVTSC